jgi:hypothetical protein
VSQREYSGYQKKVIERYYENLDGIMLQKLQELVTDLFLAKDGPKEDKLWDRAALAMKKLKVKPKIQEHIMQKRSVEVLASNVEDWIRQSKK